MTIMSLVLFTVASTRQKTRMIRQLRPPCTSMISLFCGFSCLNALDRRLQVILNRLPQWVLENELCFSTAKPSAHAFLAIVVNTLPPSSIPKKSVSGSSHLSNFWASFSTTSYLRNLTQDSSNTSVKKL